MATAVIPWKRLDAVGWHGAYRVETSTSLERSVGRIKIDSNPKTQNFKKEKRRAEEERVPETNPLMA